MVRPPFILVLLATSCHLQSVPPPSATSLVLHDSAAVGDSDSLAKTIDEMAKKTGLTLSEDQLGLVKSMASGNFHAKTLTKMMGSMAGDLKKDQKDEFNDFANRVVGWKRKKETIQNKMILELANGTTDAKNMRAYMKKMNLNAIINTVQKTYSGSAEWDRIKAFVDRVNKDPHGQSSSEETEPETGGPDPLPEKPAHDREIHSGETQNLDVNTEEEGEGVSAEETGEKEGSGEDDISEEEEEGSGEDEPAADEPFVDVEEGSVEEGSGEVDGSGEDSAAEAYVLADNEEPGH